MGAVQKLDVWKKIEFANVREPQTLQQFPQIKKSPTLAEIHVVTGNGKVFRGFKAFRYLARYLPLLWPILPLLYLPGASWVGQRAYEWLARRRFLFG